MDNTAVSNLSPLGGMPLTRLRLDDCERLHDLAPLADCKQLEVLTIPSQCENIAFLRSLPKLKRLSYVWAPGGWEELPTAAEFWKEYDEKKRTEVGG